MADHRLLSGNAQVQYSMNAYQNNQYQAMDIQTCLVHYSSLVERFGRCHHQMDEL